MGSSATRVRGSREQRDDEVTPVEADAATAAGSREPLGPRHAVGDEAGPEGAGSREPAGQAEVDRVEAVGEEIIRLAAHLHAGKGRVLELVAEFDRGRGWERVGHRSCAHWLSVNTGYDLRTARGYVRVARALEGLPATRASMARGRLAYSQVRALTRVATPETESDLLELAEACTTATLERRVRAWKTTARREAADRERALHRARRLSAYPDEDGMYVVRARLEPEVGAAFLRAIEAAGDALYREAADEADLTGGSRDPMTASGGRREGRSGGEDGLPGWASVTLRV